MGKELTLLVVIGGGNIRFGLGLKRLLRRKEFGGVSSRGFNRFFPGGKRGLFIGTKEGGVKIRVLVFPIVFREE